MIFRRLTARSCVDELTMAGGFGPSPRSPRTVEPGEIFVEMVRDFLSQVFHGTILVSHYGRARIDWAECRVRTVLKFDFGLGLGLTNGSYCTS
jgi:hypothetical protein